MSRLELALRKARATAADADRSGDEGVVPPARVLSSAFVSAWHFDEAQEPAAAAPESAADVTREATAVARAATAVVVRPVNVLPGKDDVAPLSRDLSVEVREKLAVGADALPRVREQFRKIAASLFNLRESREIKVVMIVSASPGEGKTLTATNLALTLSESYRCRVLLVDGDLRRPNVHQMFEMPNKIGLKDALAADPAAPLPIVRISSHLELLTAGTASIDPMSALTSERMRLVIGQAAGEFDWIVLDTPPAELLPDARILASLADAAILVVEAASTSYELAQRAIENIGRDRFVGVVLNQLTDTRDAGENSYYGDVAGEHPRGGYESSAS
jgi:capsular exopolysaccharide synthesis family protein